MVEMALTGQIGAVENVRFGEVNTEHFELLWDPLSSE
jgi:hypothetical protein